MYIKVLGIVTACFVRAKSLLENFNAISIKSSNTIFRLITKHFIELYGCSECNFTLQIDNEFFRKTRFAIAVISEAIINFIAQWETETS